MSDLFLYVGGMPGDAITAWRIVAGGAAVEHVATVGGLHAPSFLKPHPELPLLYVAERKWADEDSGQGAISIFAIDRTSGSLAPLGRIGSGGASTAHVNISPDGRVLLAANPRGPNISAFPLDAAGLPKGPATVMHHSGRGPRPRQAEPWPHSCFSDRSGRRVFACDLGTDRVMIYELGEAGQLRHSATGYAQVASGAGARHLLVSEDNRFVYVVNELDSSLCVFEHEPNSGTLTIVQTLETVPPEFAEGNLPAEIAAAQGERFLLVTNRGHDSLAIFARNATSGRLSPAGTHPCGGKTPRHIAVAPDGQTVAVCNQDSHTVDLFRIDADARLSLQPARIHHDNPTCAAFFGPSTHEDLQEDLS